LINFVYY